MDHDLNIVYQGGTGMYLIHFGYHYPNHYLNDPQVMNLIHFPNIYDTQIGCCIIYINSSTYLEIQMKYTFFTRKLLTRVCMRSHISFHINHGVHQKLHCERYITNRFTVKVVLLLGSSTRLIQQNLKYDCFASFHNQSACLNSSMWPSHKKRLEISFLFLFLFLLPNMIFSFKIKF